MASSQHSSSLVQRCSDFVAEHKKAVLLGTAAVAIAAGSAYYASTSRRPGGGDKDEGKSKDKKKSGKSSKPKRKTVKDIDGPLLEERSPKIVEEDSEHIRV